MAITVLGGIVAADGFGVAGGNLAHVARLIEERLGLGPLVPGTLNLTLPSPYIVEPDAMITNAEYNRAEFIKLKRCVVRGLRCGIMRPNTHESVPRYGHGAAYLELLSAHDLKSELGLSLGDRVEVEVGGDATWWANAK